MKSTIDTDTVLDLVRQYQKDLASRVDREVRGSGAHSALWTEYKLISGLYDAIRKAAQ